MICKVRVNVRTAPLTVKTDDNLLHLINIRGQEQTHMFVKKRLVKICCRKEVYNGVGGLYMNGHLRWQKAFNQELCCTLLTFKSTSCWCLSQHLFGYHISISLDLPPNNCATNQKATPGDYFRITGFHQPVVQTILHIHSQLQCSYGYICLTHLYVLENKDIFVSK